MTTESKVRWLAEQAGWLLPDPGVQHGYPPGGLDCVALPDYPNSFDAIARDLLPLLRERKWALTLHCTPEAIQAWITNRLGQALAGAADAESPAAAAMEAIFEALHGATE